MSFVAVRGLFQVTGYSPDGDSVRFKPSDPTVLRRLNGTGNLDPKVLSGEQPAQLRFEAIDTLETHYQNQHQPAQFADQATNHLLNLLGIHNVQWTPDRSRVTKADDMVQGTILVRDVEKYGRPVSIVFRGWHDHLLDGADVFVDADLFEQSANNQMVESGLAYVTLYQGLPEDLRTHVTGSLHDAKAAKRGLWTQDVTTTGFDVDDLQSITNMHVIMPKLFRRLVDFLKTDKPMSQFSTFLEKKQDPVRNLKTGDDFENLSRLIEIRGNRVRLLANPEDLLFLS